MFNCDWVEVHYFIQNERDDTEHRLSLDKILTKTMETDVKELKSKDLKQVITNVLPENSRKPKMKGKATKVFKYLMNFLKMKPKRKFEDLERLCLPSTQDSFTYENPATCRLATPKPTACHKTDGILSMSWSYLVHDPFKEDPSLEEPHDPEFEVSYDESYFEDDYCQDYHENDVAAFRSATCDIQNLSYGSRLFEPERTPCGEFKRSVVSRVTPCRRYASVPNFSLDTPILSAALADATEMDPVDESRLIDIDDFMLNHPPVGLNIVFDNVLDENSCENRVYSVNRVPFSSTEETEQFECNGEGFWDETYTCQQESPVSDCSGSEKLTSADKTPQGYHIARDSIHKLEMLGQSIEPTEGPGEVVSEALSGLEKCTLNTFLPSSSCERFPSLTHVSKHQDISSLTKRTSKQYGSVESGYSSSGSPSSGSPEIMSLAAAQGTHSGHPYMAAAAVVVSLSNAQNNLTDFSGDKFQQVHSKAAQQMEFIQTNAFRTSTSSPMRIINTPAFLDTKILPSMIISPINQIIETPKVRHTAFDSQGCLKRSRHHRRNESTAIDSNFQSKYLRSNTKTNVTVADPFCDDLIVAAAEFILSRIYVKEELKSYIKVEELVAYLKSHYMSEIELSNINVKSISEYRQITQASCDMFTSDRLNPTNSYCQLLTAVLADRPRMVSACEQFIFENRDSFIRSRHFFEAPPEVILMLLCNNPSTIFGTVEVPIRSGDLGLELNRHLDKYIEKHRAENPRIYFRVKNIFTCIQKKMTNLTRVNSAALKLHAKDPLDQESKRQNSLNNNTGDSNSTPLSSVHCKAISNMQNNTLQMCKGTRMFRNKQLLFTTQGNVPETTQKLLDYVGARKTPCTHRSSHQSELSFATDENPSEFVQRYTADVSKYKVFSNSPFPSEEPKRTKITHSTPVYTVKTSSYDSQKWKLPRSTVKYVTVV